MRCFLVLQYQRPCKEHLPRLLWVSLFHHLSNGGGVYEDGNILFLKFGQEKEFCVFNAYIPQWHVVK